MFPRNVKCEDCGQIASVRGYGRIQYDWPETITAGRETTIPAITCVRLTIDCPHCGVKSQEFFPSGSRPRVPHPPVSTEIRDLAKQKLEVRFRRIGPMRPPRF